MILSYREVIMKRSRVPVTVSLPSNLAENFERLAKAEAKNKSQLFREMLTVYERRRREEQFHELQRYGVKKARKKGVLTEAEVEKLVFQGR
jgi:metal-responsive CopG/Arc/MetJ family transcriptional regulator